MPSPFPGMNPYLEHPDRWSTTDLYGFGLMDPIPAFLLPLRSPDPEPLVSLQDLVNDVYDRSGYDYFIDYGVDPLVSLSDSEKDWVNKRLKSSGVR